MRATHFAVGVVVVSLLAVGATAPAAAQVDGNSGEAICADAPPNGDSLVVVLPDDTYVYANEGVTLLPGTEADIALCSGGDVVSTGAWPVSDIDGVNVTGSDEFSYGITTEPVETRTNATFDSAISQRGEVNTPAVTVVPGRVTTTHVGGEPYRIALSSDHRNTFMNANTSYATTRSEMRNAAAALNDSLPDDERIPEVIPDDERIPEVNQTDTLNEEYTTIQDLLFTSAADGNTAAADALEAYEQQHTASLAETRNHLRNANQAIEAQARSTALGVLANFIGVALVGAIVGGVGGRVATNRILSGVEVDRRRSSAVDFSPKHLAGQVGFALLSIVGAVALVVGLGLLAPLVAVVRAVIGV